MGHCLHHSLRVYRTSSTSLKKNSLGQYCWLRPRSLRCPSLWSSVFNNKLLIIYHTHTQFTLMQEYTKTACKDVLTHWQGQTTSGVYTIQPDNQPAFRTYCDMETDDGGWTVFQCRMDGSANFYCDYQQGFGNLNREFWLGLDKIHHLTSTLSELQVDMWDFEGNSAYAHAVNNFQCRRFIIQVHSVSIRIQWNCRRLSWLP